MSELLTTGQMIDKLNLWESAESVGKLLNYKVTRRSHGIVLKDEEPLSLNALALEIKWRILPNYVSFEEAMKALREAKAVYFHDGDWKGRIVYGQWLEDSEISGYAFAQLINGKWTIEGDSDV